MLEHAEIPSAMQLSTISLSFASGRIDWVCSRKLPVMADVGTAVCIFQQAENFSAVQARKSTSEDWDSDTPFMDVSERGFATVGVGETALVRSDVVPVGQKPRVPGDFVPDRASQMTRMTRMTAMVTAATMAGLRWMIINAGFRK
jgi:hypothetical protein